VPDPEPLLTPHALARLSGLSLVARTIVEGYLSGRHRSPFHGFSVEFSEYREYVPGDDLRHFDWKAYGKSDRRYIRKYHSETNLVCRLVLDRSASMGYAGHTSHGVTKLRYAVCLAAALAHLLQRQGDAVGLTLFSDRVETVLPGKSSPRHLRDLFGVLEAVEPVRTTAMAPALHEVAATKKRRGLVVLLSDLFDDPEAIMKGLRHFRFQGHEVLVFHVLDPAELDFPFQALADFKDMETGERLQVHPHTYRADYRREVNAFVEDLRRRCSEIRADYQLVRTDQPFDAFLAHYLHRRERLR
jgi:uncharacterized protein (DUF58 family)